MSMLRTQQPHQTLLHFCSIARSTPRWYLTNLAHVRNAHHKSESRANGSKNGAGKRLGAKKGSDEYVIPGNIIFRQRGTQWFPGENCDMGRDHTIFAKESGYVRFYRDPHRHPRRRYIGVALESTWNLPTPLNAVRRRRLGMLAVKRKDIDLEALSERNNTEVATSIPANSKPRMTRAEKRTAKAQTVVGKIPIKDLVMGPGYQWRMSNAEIGRSAERARVRCPVFKHGNRFLAWRMRTRRRERAALRRTVEANTRKGKLEVERMDKKKMKMMKKGKGRTR